MILALVLFWLSGSAQAASCLLPYDPATYDYIDTCVSPYGWSHDYVEVSSCTLLNMQADVGNMDPYCAAGFGGTYVDSSNDCGGQGVLDGHLDHSCREGL